ncbi:xanthine dehydrogenase accessory protein XdhC [Halodurantibacterium flavum]|uniref:Xanthine dehydrogenase accessory protein XdhC n=1 Tax=Halodurantibacterium flavum TaxID=1382802 RepID=A0ABW4S2W7_9RHOB
MSFDLSSLRAAVADHGAVIRVVMAEVAGSTPREVGTAMLVWASGQSGTIGGGALEYEATARARAMLSGGERLRLDRQALGPHLGQCCGGSVTLLSELWDRETVEALQGPVIARRVTGTDAMPFGVRRLLAGARSGTPPPRPGLIQGWMVEPLSQPDRHLWVWGAGHVGRALVDVLSPLPGIAITWIDTDAARFPPVPPGVTQRISPTPADLVKGAPATAEHLILTYSHDLDLELCHRLLGHGFGWCGLIGSATKWARFRNRLSGLGHTDAQILCIACPIGDPTLGKHPQAIAVGVAAALLRRETADQSARDSAG